MTAPQHTAISLALQFTLEELRGLYDQISTADILLHPDSPLHLTAPDGSLIIVTARDVVDAKLRSRGWGARPIRPRRRRSAS